MRRIILLAILFSTAAYADQRVVPGDVFQVNVFGNTVKLTAPSVTDSYVLALPPAQGTGSLVNDGTGSLSWATIVGGITALTGDVTASGTGSVAATVASVGGQSAASVASTVTTVAAATTAATNSTLMLRDSSANTNVNELFASQVNVASGSFQVNSSGNITELNGVTTNFPSSQGSSGTYLQNNGSGTLSWSSVSSGLAIGNTVGSGTAGSLLFVDNVGLLDQNNTNLFWDVNNQRLGIGTNTPAQPFTVKTSGIGIAGFFGGSAGASEIYVGDVLNNDQTGVIGYDQTDGMMYLQPYGDALGNGLTIGNNGYVGVGKNSTAPTSALDVYGKFKVDNNGNITLINNIATNWPSSQGSASTYLQNDGSGNLSWAAGGGGGGMAIGNPVTGGTSGSALYVDSSGYLAQNNADYFWDQTNHRLGLNTSTPSQTLEVDGEALIYNSSGAAFIAQVNQNTGTTFGMNNLDTSGTIAVDFKSNGSLVSNMAYIGNYESGGHPYFALNGNPGNIPLTLGGTLVTISGATLETPLAATPLVVNNRLNVVDGNDTNPARFFTSVGSIGEIYFGQSVSSNYQAGVLGYDIGHGILYIQPFGTPLGNGITVANSGNVGVNFGNIPASVTLDINGQARLAKVSSSPFSCASGVDGAIALTHLYTLCVCNGGTSTWVEASDGVTSCSF